MKKKTNRLSKFEKRVEERHKRQEAEYGRDEFLFGAAEDEEEADVEYETESWTTDAIDLELVRTQSASGSESGEKKDADREAESGETGDEPAAAPVGSRTEMIADEIMSAELASLAEEMASEDSDTENEKEFYDEEFDDYADRDEDYDFYDMPDDAEAAAITAAEKLYGRDEMPHTPRQPRVHRAASAASGGKKAGKRRKRSETSRKSPKSYDDRYDYPDEDEYEDEGGFFASMSTADRLIAITGVCVLAVAIAAGAVFMKSQTIRKQVAAFKTVGESSADIYVVGEQGINSVVAARAGYVAVAEIPEEPEPEEEQPSEEVIIDKGNVAVVMKVTSVQSDLKIKFSNKSSDKLIPGVAFTVKVTSDSGKEYTWTDDNKDGVIYHTEVPNGTYKVVMQPLTGEDAERYEMPSDVSGVKVTDKIQYKKIDVADEVKSEAEVNVAQEDTAVQDTVVESVLKDTVEWVESTKTVISGGEGGYQVIDKAEVVLAESKLDPAGSLMTSRTAHMLPVMGAEPGEGEMTDIVVSIAVSPVTLKLKPGEYATVVAQVSGTDNPAVRWVSDNTAVADVSEGIVVAASEGTATIYALSLADTSKFAICMVTVTGEGGGGSDVPVTVTDVTLNKTALKIGVGETAKVKATVTKSDGSKGSVIWTSSNEAVATVADGKVTGVSAGTTNIIALSADDNSKYAYCEVTVEETAQDATVSKITIEPAKLKLGVGQSATLTATVTMSDSTTSDKVIWLSGNESIATVADGKVTAVAAGNTDIYAASAIDNNVYTVCQLTVTDDSTPDMSTPLKDKSGNTVYVKNANGEYVKATLADYMADAVLYIMGQVKYTGWQVLDGFTYFFDKNGQFITGDHIIQGAHYTFDANGHLSTGSGTMGIDVSKWNGNIDWKAVKNSGVSYVIIRCGYRGSTTGALIEDPKFRSNIQGAKAAGLSVGAYFFTQAVNEVEAVEEASMAVGLCSGYGLNLPIFLDVEKSGGRADGIGADMRTAVCRAFCQTVQNSGVNAGIYANKTWLTEKMHASQLTAYKIWLAQYAASPSYSATKYDFWQYTSKGKITGISGNVDLNIRF